MEAVGEAGVRVQEVAAERLEEVVGGGLGEGEGEVEGVAVAGDGVVGPAVRQIEHVTGFQDEGVGGVGGVDVEARVGTDLLR